MSVNTKPTFFPKPSEFRKWLEKNHAKETELLVGYYKVGSGKPSMSWSESVDEALCFGWIDGVRRSIDEESYSIRFTPRKPSSIWSAVNIKKVAELTEKGLMKEAGLAAFNQKKHSKSGYGREQPGMKFSPEMAKRIKAHKKAWAYFQALARGYQKLSVNWVMGAKQEATRNKRMEQLIADCEAGTNQWKDNKYK